MPVFLITSAAVLETLFPEISFSISTVLRGVSSPCRNLPGSAYNGKICSIGGNAGSPREKSEVVKDLSHKPCEILIYPIYSFENIFFLDLIMTGYYKVSLTINQGSNKVLYGGIRMKRSWIKGLVIFLFLASTYQMLQAQATSKEVSATVPALTEFHRVIYKIWHTAWPNRDYDMLTALLPEIEKGTASIVSAELPGILRDKKPAWEKGVGELRAIVQEYRTAVETKQKQALLDAAERLHAQYEALVRVIRPPLRQLEEFHVVLYMVYHYYMPEESLDKIRGSVEPLRERMAALGGITLPARFKDKEASFRAARKDLEEAVIELDAAVSSNDLGKIKHAVETMHSRYLKLATVLE